MITATDPVNVDTQPTDITYWVDRCCNNRGRDTEYHLIYRDATLTVHPDRAALTALDGREVFVGHDPKRHKGRGWLGNLVTDIEEAINTLEDGGGKEPAAKLGDLIREEITQREAGNRTRAPDRTHWIQWLDEDELPVLMGAWLHRIGMLHHKYELTRRPKLGFNITSDEFELGLAAIRAKTTWTLLQRLSANRQIIYKETGVP